MAKLYPPGLKGSLPAFYDITEIRIPFLPNRTVYHSEENLAGFCLLIKTVQTNEILGTIKTNMSRVDLENNTVVFNLDEDEISNEDLTLVQGDFYKVQLAYIDTSNSYIELKDDLNWTNNYVIYYKEKASDPEYKIVKNKTTFNSLKKKDYLFYKASDVTLGYYSTVGIIKYTKKPEVIISNLSLEQVNDSVIEFQGKYKNEDSNEKVYSYQFYVYDSDYNLFETSGEKIHNHYNDSSLGESLDSFVLTKSLDEGEKYYISYRVITQNGLDIASPVYTIEKFDTIEMETKIGLKAKLNEENAYINLYIYSSANTEEDSSVKGRFIVTRASNKDNYSSWNELLRFTLEEENLQQDQLIFQDFTIEHGYFYQYAIQQYNSHDFYTNRFEDSKAFVQVNFEHLFLYDGEKQLKIKYNPKVSGYKKIRMETKVDTIGSKYPFIFRNDIINYKQFSIEGLISYHSDEENLFIKEEELFFYEDKKYYTYNNNAVQLNTPENKNGIHYPHRDINLSNKNISAERIFREKVLNFLEDGKAKILKSPQEGNYIVHLTNISLTPKEELGRMLYSFTAQVNEIDDYVYQSLIKYGFMTVKEPSYNIYRWKTINTVDFYKYKELFKVNEQYIKLNFNDPIRSFSIKDAAPGTKYQIIQDGKPQIIVIGTSGQYSMNFKDNFITSLAVLPSKYSGLVTFEYTEDTFDEFDLLKRIIKKNSLEIKQFIGKRYISEEFNDKFCYHVDYKYLQFERRPQVTLYIPYQGEKIKTFKDFKDFPKKFYTDITCQKEFTNIFEPYYIYEIKRGLTNDSFEFDVLKKEESPLFYIDISQVGKVFPKIGYKYKRFVVGDIDIYDYDKNSYYIKNSEAVGWIHLDLEQYTEKQQKTIIEGYFVNPYYDLAVRLPIERNHIIDGTEEAKIMEYLEKNPEASLEDILMYSNYKDYYKIAGKYTNGQTSIEYEDKIYILPEEFDNNVILLKLNNNKLEYGNYDLSEGLQILTTDISELINIEIGWGVTATLGLQEKNYEYNIDSYIIPSLKKEMEENLKLDKSILDNHNKYISSKIAYINALLEYIHSYELGEEGEKDNVESE